MSENEVYRPQTSTSLQRLKQVVQKAFNIPEVGLRKLATTELGPIIVDTKISPEQLMQLKEQLQPLLAKGRENEIARVKPESLQKLREKILSIYGDKLGKRWINKVMDYYTSERILVLNPHKLAEAVRQIDSFTGDTATNNPSVNSDRYNNTIGLFLPDEGIILIEAGTPQLMSQAIREEIAHALLDTPAKSRRIGRLIRAGKWNPDKGSPEAYYLSEEERIAKEIALQLGNRSIERDIHMANYGYTLNDLLRSKLAEYQTKSSRNCSL